MGWGLVRDGVGQDAGGVAVGEVEELEGHALGVGVHAHVGEQEVDQAGVARPFRGAGVLERGRWM